MRTSCSTSISFKNSSAESDVHATSDPPATSLHRKSESTGCVTCSHQHIVGDGVPAQDAHTFGVALQLDHRFCERRVQPAVRDLPNLERQTRQQMQQNVTEGSAVRSAAMVTAVPTMTLQSSEPLAMMLSL